MKKFIAPTVRVIKYESNHICEGTSISVGEGDRGGTGFVPDEGDDYEYAPSRRIFGE